MATTAELLVEAEAAYHRLMTGQSVVEVRDQNGEAVTYNRVSASALWAYIQSLKRLIADDATAVRPMRPYF